MSNEKESFFSKVKWAISSVFIGFATVIIGFFLGFFRGKKISDNGNGITNIRKQSENISRDSKRLTDTNRTTEEILRTVRSREQKELD